MITFLYYYFWPTGTSGRWISFSKFTMMKNSETVFYTEELAHSLFSTCPVIA